MSERADDLAGQAAGAACCGGCGSTPAEASPMAPSTPAPHAQAAADHGHPDGACANHACVDPAPPEACGEDACGCKGGVPVFDGVDPRYKRILWLVIAINGAMFLIEMTAGALGRSQALKADALDFLGDTLTYGLSLAVIGTAIRVRAAAAMLKGLSLSLMAAFVLGSTVYGFFVLGLPRAEVMGTVGLMALAANLSSVLLLARYKDGDANVRSVWLCSRNDAIGNVLVMGAGVAVWALHSPWPHLLVAGAMAALFFRSSVQILSQALAEYRSGPRPQPAE